MTLRHFFELQIWHYRYCILSCPAWTPERANPNLRAYSNLTVRRRKKKKKGMQNRMAALRVFCGYISGAVCGQRYLSPWVFSDCQLLVIKLKMHSCQTRQKTRPSEAACPETPFGPSSRTSETGADRHTQTTRRLPSKQKDLRKFTSSHPHRSCFFNAVRARIASETLYSIFGFWKKNKTFS